MKLTPIIKQMREYCPSFQNRVFGGMDWVEIEPNRKFDWPAAYLLVGDDDAEPSSAQNAVSQVVKDTFDVCIVFAMINNGTSQLYDSVHLMRAELFKALVGWRPDTYYDPIQYISSELVDVNRARLVYKYTFSSEFQLGRNLVSEPAETWEEHVYDGLPELKGLNINVDAIDPMVDKNFKPDGVGPDGRVEIKAVINLEKNDG